MDDHVRFPNAEKATGLCPRRAEFFWAELNSEATLSDPAQPACPRLQRSSAQEKRTLNPAFQLSRGKKSKLLMRTLRLQHH